MSEVSQKLSCVPPETKEPPFANDHVDEQLGFSRSQLIQSGAEFIRDFVPPDYLIDGILQRRFCYSLTATTGTGKTAILLRVSAHIALGQAIGNLRVEQGKVLYFAGENPDDIRMRWIGLAQEMGFDPEGTEVYFMPGIVKLSVAQQFIIDQIRRIGQFSLIVVDTSPAYFEGEDENNNSQMGAHARRLRRLCEIPGGPCVLIACHPTKNAGDDSLTPRGGGAFLAEVDGNLTARKEKGAVAVHHQGKFRGAEFAPIRFGLRSITHQRLKDSRGRPVPTVVAYPMGENAYDEMAATARSQDNQLLVKFAETPSASLAELARALDWKLQNGEPSKMKVSRRRDALVKSKLLKKEGDSYVLTPAGYKEVAGQAASKSTTA